MTSPQPDAAYDIARRLGHPEPDDELLQAVVDALGDAEDDVVGYLGRPIRPVTKVANRCWPVLGGWSIPSETGRIREIVSAVPETLDGVTTGTFTITYTVGLDYVNDAELGPIRRYVRAAAMNDPMLMRRLDEVAQTPGEIKSVSVSTEGQSKNVTYEKRSYGGGGQAGADSPGALPSKKSMDRWRLAGRRVHQAPDLGYDSRIYGTVGGRYRDSDGFWNNA